MELNNHAIGWASDADIRDALNSSDGVLEWETVGYTFVKSARACVIVRSGALGGDTREVHGGWKYGNVFAMERSWAEILLVAGCYTQAGPRSLLMNATMRHKKVGT
jgi:hypothetical protein